MSLRNKFTFVDHQANKDADKINITRINICILLSKVLIFMVTFTTDDTKVMLAAEEWCTGAAVFTDVLDPEVLEHVERDVETFIRAFDEGYEPPSSPGSLTSGEGTPSNQIFRGAFSSGRCAMATKPLL